MKYDVIGFGGSVVDCLLHLVDPTLVFQGKGGQFRPDLELPIESRRIIEWTIQGGGLVATAMAAVGRLGAKVAMITKVGDDEWGRFIISNFKKYNVDTSHIFVDRGIRTWITFILVGKNGSNQWVRAETLKDFDLPDEVSRAANWVMTRPRTLEERERSTIYTLDELDILTESKILNLGSADNAFLEAAQSARKKGIPTCLDMETGILMHPNLRELLKNVTYCIPSRRSAMEFTKEADPKAMCKKILSYGPEVAGVTLGEDGSVFATRNETVVRGAFQIPVVDTTGAGDVFHGAFSLGIVKGWDLARVVEFASAVAAMKCRKLGGRAGIPTLPEVEAFLRERVQEIR